MPIALPGSEDAGKVLFRLPPVAIVGQSGTGKSHALSTLPPDVSCLIDIELKGFPFPRSLLNKFWYRQVQSWAEWGNVFAAAMQTDNKIVAIDSLTQLLIMCEQWAIASSVDGFKAWDKYGKAVYELLQKFKNPDKLIIVTGIDEWLTSAGEQGQGNVLRRKLASRGKMWEGKLETQFTYVLFTMVKASAGAEPTYHFMTRADGINTAKCPPGTLPMVMPNDLSLLLKAIEKYEDVSFAKGVPLIKAQV